VAPPQCLFYTTWSGMAEADGKSPNHTEQLLAEPEVRFMIEELHKRLTVHGVAWAREEHPELAPLVEDAVKWGTVLLTHPGAIFVSRPRVTLSGPDLRAGMVFHVGPQAAELKTTLEAHQQKYLPGAAQPVEIAGQTWHRITLSPAAPPITWGIWGEYLVVGVGTDAVKEILARCETPAPPWLGDLRKTLPVKRLSTLTYIDVNTTVDTVLLITGGDPKVSQMIDATGLGGVTSLSSVTGLDEQGVVGRGLIGLEGEPKGLFRVIAEKPLTKQDLAPVPKDALAAVAFRLDADRLMETVLSMAEQILPEAAEEIAHGIDSFKGQSGVGLREDLLQALGDVWCVYTSTREGGPLLGATAVVQVRDRAKLAAAQAKLVELARKQVDPNREQDPVGQFEFAGQQVYWFHLGRNHDLPIAPAWCLTERELVVSMMPQGIKSYLSHDAASESLATAPELAAVLEAGEAPLAVGYLDTRRAFELAYPWLQMFVQAAVGELARDGAPPFDISLLPSAAAIGRHLQPAVVAMRRTTAGIEITSRQTVPGTGMVLVLPIPGFLWYQFESGTMEPF
jgi:hypothetical protein